MYTITHTHSDDVARIVPLLPPEFAFAVQFLAATGARIGELIALRRDQIDPGKGVIHLNGKTGPRDFPLTDGLIKLLGERMDQSSAAHQLGRGGPSPAPS
ncbi:MAG: tyrosine-type recombinase/integrase [Deltaproteobacteria bacterium]|nr:tyrosine-type recombinase/integrase [Deltaproteobacteria bacterium]